MRTSCNLYNCMALFVLAYKRKRLYLKVSKFVSEVCIHSSLSLADHESNHRNTQF